LRFLAFFSGMEKEDILEIWTLTRAEKTRRGVHL